MKQGVPNWPNASRRLARRVMRWERVGAWLWPLGIALGLGALVTLAAKAVGIGPPTALVPIGAASLVGLLLGLRRARRLGRIGDADAAWALDRIAGAKERGLVAATVEGPVAAEAAWGVGRIDPPRVRLLPPKGLVLALGTGLLAAVSVLAPARAPAAEPVEAAAQTQRTEPRAGAPALGADEAQARVDQATALEAAAIREALGLGPRAATDPSRIARRLEEPKVQDAVREAARKSGDAELQRLAQAGAAGADGLAKRLGDGVDAARRAEEARRRLTAHRASGRVAHVPAHRRAYLERYFMERGAAAGER